MSDQTAASRDAIRTTMAALRHRLDALPRISVDTGEDLMTQHSRHREAVDQLIGWLADRHNARTRQRSDGTWMITIHRITSSSTGGGAAALANWLVAAERKIG